MAYWSQRFRIISFVSLLTVIVSLAAFVRFLILELDQLDPESLSTDFPTFMFMNFCVAVLMVLAFLVVKNVVRLILDRRRRILGAQLRTRLVVAFVLLSLVPTVLLFAVSRGIVGSVMSSWFSPQVAASVDGALAVAKFHYDAVERSMKRQTGFLADQIYTLAVARAPRQSAGRLDDIPQFEFLRPTLELKAREYGLAELAVTDSKGQVLIAVHGVISPVARESLPPLERLAIEDATLGRTIVLPQQNAGREFLRAYVPILSLDGPGVEPGERVSYVLVATMPVSGELRDKMSEVIEAYDGYKRLRSSRRFVSQGYLLTLIGVTMFVLVLAIWVGFYLARMLTVPIQHLAEGTQEIAKGNLDVRIPEIGGDELSILVHSFNSMTADLKRTNGELVSRRRYMETVLASVEVGVISLDSERTITTANIAAREMLGLGPESEALQKPFASVLSKPLVDRLNAMLDDLAQLQGGENLSTSTVSLVVRGATLHLNVSASRLTGEGGEPLGTVVLLDDLTELVSAQRLAAWQEVARRIAHEIKNPLTPIQLSAQRIRRKFEAREAPERAVVIEGTDTIVKQVETLRNLVNEFSRFARMPKAHPVLADLNTVVRDAVRVFHETHPELNFEVVCDSQLPMISIDREQIARVLVNLFENALASIRESGREGTVWVETREDRALGFVTIHVGDNGAGVSDEDKTKLFEPYFSRRVGGTGLGLAIVHSIVTDHGGFVRVKDREPFGALFVIEIPVRGTGAQTVFESDPLPESELI